MKLLAIDYNHNLWIITREQFSSSNCWSEMTEVEVGKTVVSDMSGTSCYIEFKSNLMFWGNSGQILEGRYDYDQNGRMRLYFCIAGVFEHGTDFEYIREESDQQF